MSSDRSGDGSDPRVSEINELVAEFSEQHGFTVQDQGLVLAEETGELCEEILKLKDGKLFKDNEGDIRGEIGDVIYTVWTIAYLCGINPITAANDTARRNQRRSLHTDSDREGFGSP